MKYEDINIFSGVKWTKLIHIKITDKLSVIDRDLNILFIFMDFSHDSCLIYIFLIMLMWHKLNYNLDIPITQTI